LHSKGSLGISRVGKEGGYIAIYSRKEILLIRLSKVFMKSGDRDRGLDLGIGVGGTVPSIDRAAIPFCN
jgi:hypothetical protein